MLIKPSKRKLISISLFLLVLIIASNARASPDPDLSIASDSICFSKLNPEAGEEVAVYAFIYNAGEKADATVRFYEGDGKAFIGEEMIVVDKDSSAIAKIYWQPTYGTQKIYANIEDVNPSDTDLSDNEANISVEFYEGVSALEVSAGVATVEEGIERVIPVEVEAFQDLNNVNLTIIYQGDLEVTLLSIPSQDMKAGEILKFYLKIKVPNLKGDEVFDNKTILVQASNSDFYSNIAELKISIHPSVESSNWWAATMATAAAGTLGAFAALGSTEVGKYKFLSFLLPLYTKLKKDEILDHYTRGKIHGYILANPGDHYNSIKKSLKISNSSFAYHLHVLEREGVIKSRRDGIYKRFYTSEVQIPSNGNVLKESQRLIIDKIKETPGISQKDIASFLGVSSSTVNYHLQDLIRDNTVKARRIGMKVRYFLTNSAN